MEESKKLKSSKLMEESCEIKEYIKDLNLHDARILFKHRTSMTQYVKFNYKNDPINRACLWKCDSCQSNIDTQDHIMWCPAYLELREGKNMKDDKDLIEYFGKVLKIREKLKLTK